MSMNSDFHDLLHAFSESEVRFLVVGAHAVGVHGLPRATRDLDVWVEATRENAAAVFSALGRFGAPTEQVTPADFERPGTIYQIGVPPRRIDLMTSIAGVRFEDAWSRRASVTIEGMTIPVLGRNDLIANKKAAGRPQDLADVARLERQAR